MVDKTGEHLLDGFPGFEQAGLELRLLEKDFLEAALGVVQRTLGERGADDFAYYLDLPVQPVVVQHQFADVFDEQAEQAEQAQAQFCLIFGE